jgi:hypothetical protein
MIDVGSRRSLMSAGVSVLIPGSIYPSHLLYPICLHSTCSCPLTVGSHINGCSSAPTSNAPTKVLHGEGNPPLPFSISSFFLFGTRTDCQQDPKKGYYGVFARSEHFFKSTFSFEAWKQGVVQAGYIPAKGANPLAFVVLSLHGHSGI